MNPKPSGNTAIDQYLTELENEELAPWEQDQKALDTEDWFEQVAADFLAKPAIDPTLEEILEATKAFTRKNFALRAGLLYRQQLQNTPDYETVLALEPDLLRLAGEANWLASHTSLLDAQATIHEYKQREADHNKAIIQWAVETLMPKLEGSSVVKITRSTKKPKNMLASCPPAILAKVGVRYKSILERAIDPKVVDQELGKSSAIIELCEWMAAASGRAMPSEGIALAMLWSSKERKQWIYGLVEYATELVNLVALAQALDPLLKPRKYLCYFQKKSEATLYRGQEELEAMIKNMQADKLLPTYDQSDDQSEVDFYDNERDSAGWDEETVQELDPRFARHATGEDNENPPAVAPPANAPKPEPTLAERLRAKRLGLS